MAAGTPLSGKSVVVTRAESQAGDLTAALERAGATAILLPMIEFAPPDSWDSLDHVIHILGRCDWVVFTSTNGVRSFFDRLQEKGLDGRSLGVCRIAAVGAATAAELRARDIEPDAIPANYRASAVAPLLPLEDEGIRIAIVRAAAGRDDLIDELRRRGARVELAIAYETRPRRDQQEKLRELVDAGTIDCVTFTSGSTATSFVANLDQTRKQKLVARAAFVSIGPSTSETMRQLGIPVSAEAAAATSDAIRDAVIAALSQR